MPDYWLDSDSLITPHRGPYSFSYGTTLWDFLEMKAHESVIGSPEIVLNMELTSTSSKNKDKLEEWAKELRGVLFVPAEASVQAEYSKVVNYVQTSGKYKQQWIASFLAGADPWLVAYPMALGGRIVTFEAPAPKGMNPKIPDVAQHFGLKKCLTMWEMLTELAFKN